MARSYTRRRVRRKAESSRRCWPTSIVRPERALGSSWMKCSNRDNSCKSCSVEAEVWSNLHSLSASTFHPVVGAQRAGRNASEPRCSLVMLKSNGASRWYYGEASSSGEDAAHAAGAHSGVTGVACPKDSSVNRGDPARTRGTGRRCPLATLSYKGHRSGEGSRWESEGPI
jgi:hypothetical protein